jgi:hypothetical protein
MIGGAESCFRMESVHLRKSMLIITLRVALPVLWLNTLAECKNKLKQVKTHVTCSFFFFANILTIQVQGY